MRARASTSTSLERLRLQSTWPIRRTRSCGGDREVAENVILDLHHHAAASVTEQVPVFAEGDFFQNMPFQHAGASSASSTSAARVTVGETPIPKTGGAHRNGNAQEEKQQCQYTHGHTWKAGRISPAFRAVLLEQIYFALEQIHFEVMPISKLKCFTSGRFPEPSHQS